MFLAWYKIDLGFAEASSNGWDYFLLGIIPWILVVAVAVVVLLPQFQPNAKLPDTFGPVSRAQGLLIAAGLAAVLVLLRLLFKDDGGVDEAEDFIDRGIGLFLAFLASLAVVGGVFMKQKEVASPGAGSGGPATPF
jgi:hypothetical protein